MANQLKLKRPRRPSYETAAGDVEPRLGVAELEAAVRAADPAARLVPPRLLRRVIRVDAGLPGFGFRVPHGKSYTIAASKLLEIADRDELGLSPTESLAPTVILLERPIAADLEEQPRDEVLLRYWELLFHARIHLRFDELKAQGRLDPQETNERVLAVGARGFDEIRNVLKQERFLLPPYDDATVYAEFAAVYLGIRYFQPHLLESFFPGLAPRDEIDRLIAADIDADELLAATQLPGAPLEDNRQPRHSCQGSSAIRPKLLWAEERLGNDLELEDAQPRSSGKHAFRIPRSQRSEAKYRNWTRRAERHVARGNLAGAIIRFARAASWAPCEKADAAAKTLREAVNHFVDRLQAALGTGPAAKGGEDSRAWRESLLALARQTPCGLWTVEARLLYDLQRACIDQERPTFTVDVMHWILSLGRRAIRRDLPDQRRVAMSRHLRSAEKRLPRVRIADRQRQQLAGELSAATKAAEADVRGKLRPKIENALDQIDLKAQNFPEQIARQKIVEEILDRVTERGFLTLGEVRDAISRNQLKEPDCSGPQSFFRGEAALRANRQLTEALDGVYEPADFYLRWILRFSHVMFGTAVGRFLTLFLIIPYGVPYATFLTLDHLIGLFVHHHPHLLRPTSLLVSGVFLQLMIYVPALRPVVWQGLISLGRAIKFVLVDAPQWFLALRWVEKIFRNAMARLVVRVVVMPAIPTLIIACFVPAETIAWRKFAGLAVVYLGLAVVVNSRVARTLEEITLDAISEGWQRFGLRPIVGLFWYTIDLFRRMLQGIESILYTVDEWLRFRSGQGRAALVGKAALGVAWFFVAYVIRFCVNLLIEPQVNPLKHFPWVTAGHKILWPILASSGLKEFLASHFGPIAGDSLFFVIGTAAPGIFGFLVWEFTENWRLFATNRPKSLQPVRIGSHGETMLHLLRPGIHSGTIPKRFAKFRRAERKALAGGDASAVRKQREALHHVEVDLHRYVEREFVAWFAEGRGWTGGRPEIGELHLATNAATVPVTIPSIADRPLVFSFRLVADVVQLDLYGEPCQARLSGTSGDVFCLALLNLVKTAEVDVMHHLQPEDSACGNNGRAIVDTIDVPWQEWVTAWKLDGAAAKAWNVLAACEQRSTAPLAHEAD